MSEITSFILQLREEYLSSDLIDSYQDINCGGCLDFAEEIEAHFNNCITLSNDHFVCEREDSDGWNGDENDIWDEENLKSYHSLPPANMTVAELTTTISGYHCWIYDGKRHYDAECPEGVENFFELPFFKRYLERE